MALDVLPSCSEASSKVAEPVSGTAIANVDVWLLLEYPGKWEADIAETPLTAEARAWLDAAAAAVPRSRVLFIRRDRASRNLSFFIVTSRPERAVYRFVARTHDEFSSIDVPAVVARGGAAAAAHGGEPSRPLYLVCTHGKRDLCCAKRGVAFTHALDNLELDGEVWQSSHQGGHRFAATMLYLPLGIHYGRLELGDADGLAAAHARGHVYESERYRGLTTLPAPQQAAEAWLREQLDERRIDAFELLADDATKERGVLTRFRARDGVVHRLTVVESTATTRRIASCDASTATSFLTYSVVRHEAALELVDFNFDS